MDYKFKEGVHVVHPTFGQGRIRTRLAKNVTSRWGSKLIKDIYLVEFAAPYGIQKVRGTTLESVPIITKKKRTWTSP